MEVRQRRSLHPNGSDLPSDDDEHSTRRTKGETIDRRFTLLILFSVLGLSLGLVAFQFAPHLLPDALHEALDQALEYLGVDQRLYAIVLDAGSTGTRILAFSFHQNLISGGNYRLENQLFAQKTPGISSFAQEPHLAAQSVEELLHVAYNSIPLHRRRETPITLKATAGLRLLPSNSASVLISTVNNVLESSDFKNLGAEIMNPMEEGLYGWFTLNYLQDSLQNEDYVCLDLGGGSTQITFSPKSPVSDLIEPWMKKSQFIHRVKVMKEDLNLYSHSYLGLGILSVRRALFRDSPSDRVVASPCLGRNTKPLHHTFQDFNYTMVGVPSSSNPYEACDSLIQALMKDIKVHRPVEIADRQIAAFSYFFDRALERGLVPEGNSEGLVRVSDFTREAKLACNEEQDIHKFHCLDLTYISSLLKDGYGFVDTREIHLVKKIKGYDVSWALGVAYTLLESQS